MECPYCKKADIDVGTIRAGYRIYFFSDKEKGKFFKSPIPVKAYLCKDCGVIFFKAEKK